MPQTQRKPVQSERQQDAIALLTEDHQQVKKMFQQFDKLKDDEQSEKEELAQKICAALTAHVIVEEEIFYPAVRAAIDDEDLMAEADVEHASAKDLIAQIEAASADDDHYDAKVKVLGEQIDHHVKEEREEMFPKARKAKIDLRALGEQIEKRKKELEQS
ncbi:MAG: hemerythrin domain-containing protein [Burkholderiales bacterium]